mgnify:CR=1 FL=1
MMHIVSHVSGELSPIKSVYDAFRSVFPAGTVSGAPKIRAMQLVCVTLSPSLCPIHTRIRMTAVSC